MSTFVRNSDVKIEGWNRFDEMFPKLYDRILKSTKFSKLLHLLVDNPRSINKKQIAELLLFEDALEKIDKLPSGVLSPDTLNPLAVIVYYNLLKSSIYDESKVIRILRYFKKHELTYSKVESIPTIGLEIEFPYSKEKDNLRFIFSLLGNYIKNEIEGNYLEINTDPFYSAYTLARYIEELRKIYGRVYRCCKYWKCRKPFPVDINIVPKDKHEKIMFIEYQQYKNEFLLLHLYLMLAFTSIDRIKQAYKRRSLRGEWYVKFKYIDLENGSSSTRIEYRIFQIDNYRDFVYTLLSTQLFSMCIFNKIKGGDGEILNLYNRFKQDAEKISGLGSPISFSHGEKLDLFIDIKNKAGTRMRSLVFDCLRSILNILTKRMK